MYASPIVLIFSRPSRSASPSKALKISSRTPTTRSGAVPLREPREVDDVGEQDRDVVVALGDDPGLVLEPLGDRPRQDVEEEPLGAGERRVAGADRVLQEHVRRDRDTHDVEDKERIADRRRDCRGVRSQQRFGKPRHDSQDDESDEPWDPFASAVEEQRPEGALERPQAHCARRDVAAEAPLEHERQQDDQDELAKAEEAVVLRSGEHGKRRDRGELIGKRDRGWDRQAEGEIRSDPDDREHGHGHCRHGQGYLLETDLVRVTRNDADERQALDEPPDGVGVGACHCTRPS